MSPREIAARPCRMVLALLAGWLTSATVHADDPPPLRPSQTTALTAIDQLESRILKANRQIWELAEVGLEERRSSQVLIDELRKEGFEVRAGVANMPTAFVATFGTGSPVIGILAEYDALPGLSQKISDTRDPLAEGAAGHGCGHSGLGAGAMGAAIAVKQAMQQHGIKGTIRLYGTPAEETVIGKVYMMLAGVFEDLDVCLHWHPGSKNEVWNGSSKALVSAKFTFSGEASHSAGTPELGRSALDGVELMNVGANFMREHLKEDARIHYVVTNGGGQPNVVPPEAEVWYYVRADDHRDVENTFKWLTDIARGAALMSRTKMQARIDTDCHELITNAPLAEAIQKRLETIPPPEFTQDEIAFARRLQQTYETEGRPFSAPVDSRVQPLKAIGEHSKGSTDVGDISWFVPTCGLRTACFPLGCPGHSWQNVASIGSTIGEKGIVYASRVLAATALDLLETPELVAAAKADLKERLKDRKYVTLIPDGQKPPRGIR